MAFINIAKGLATIDDFQELVQHVLHPPRSHGRLGGKSAGLFLARKVVEASAESASILRDIKVPRTWYLTSDAILAFLRYNNPDDVHDRKYLDVEQVRQQYPHVVQVFKSATFPPEMVKGLSSALEDLGPVPLIVRSSSLLEDRVGSAFCGKYKSLFLATQVIGLHIPCVMAMTMMDLAEARHIQIDIHQPTAGFAQHQADVVLVPKIVGDGLGIIDCYCAD